MYSQAHRVMRNLSMLLRCSLIGFLMLKQVLPFIWLKLQLHAIHLAGIHRCRHALLVWGVLIKMSGLFNLPIVASFSLSLGIQGEHYVIWITVLGCINKIEKISSLIQRERERYLFWVFSISHLNTFTNNKSNSDHFVK